MATGPEAKDETYKRIASEILDACLDTTISAKMVRVYTASRISLLITLLRAAEK